MFLPPDCQFQGVREGFDDVRPVAAGVAEHVENALPEGGARLAVGREAFGGAPVRGGDDLVGPDAPVERFRDGREPAQAGGRGRPVEDGVAERGHGVGENRRVAFQGRGVPAGDPEEEAVAARDAETEIERGPGFRPGGNHVEGTEAQRPAESEIVGPRAHHAAVERVGATVRMCPSLLMPR